MSDASSKEFNSTPNRIRSKHRRRLLSRLSQGEATVSELAKESGLRTPHASAEIRRMRAEGIVSSNLPPGSRGSMIQLTEEGWKALEDDEWSKVLDLGEIPSESGYCCVLSRDEGDLTLCFLSPPVDPMIQIPNRIVSESDGNILSTRNQGVSWSWAVLSERTPRWFDRDNMAILDSPPELAGPGRIDSYAGKSAIIGVIRARLLEPRKSSTITPGMWFPRLEQIKQAPLNESIYHRGDWVLGSTHSGSPDVRPSQPVAAIMKERLPKSVLLRSARPNSLVVADLSGLDLDGSAYPISALEYWIASAHPRLPDSERRRRLNSLRDRISTSRRVRTDESTLRKFRKHWGGAVFTTEESSIRQIDLRGLGDSAIESLIRWSLEASTIPLVLEVSSSLPSDLLSRIATTQNLRLVISENKTKHFSSFDSLEVDEIRTLPWLSFCTSSGLRIPIRLVEKGKNLSTMDKTERTTFSPWIVLGLPSESDGFFEEFDGEHASIVESAFSQFPNGNEDWANQVEARYPLAAWIASPKMNRWQRWQRVSSRLNPEWLALLDIDYLPIDKISEIAEQSPDSVRKIFSKKITSKLREDPDNLLRSWPAIDPNQANSGAAWLALHFIENSAWLPEEAYPDLLDWAFEAWLSQPPRESLGALTGLSWLYRISNKSEEEIETLFRRIRDASTIFSDEHHLSTWSKLYDHALGLNEANLDTIELILRDLPNSWWAAFSSDFLISILKSTKAEELMQFPIPWCATILRPVGEESDAPGLSSILHPGCKPEIIEHIQNFIRTSQNSSFSSGSLVQLSDIISALEFTSIGKPPSSGKAHNLSGWLAQPIEKWPSFTSEMVLDGDGSISERLILRRSGFHLGLLNPGSSSEPLGS